MKEFVAPPFEGATWQDLVACAEVLPLQIGDETFRVSCERGGAPARRTC